VANAVAGIVALCLHRRRAPTAIVGRTSWHLPLGQEPNPLCGTYSMHERRGRDLVA